MEPLPRHVPDREEAVSLTPVQVRFIVSTGLFEDAIRRAVHSLNDLAPWLLRLRLDAQRNRSRLVTRRKQRRHW